MTAMLYELNYYIGHFRYGRAIALAILVAAGLAVAVFGYRWWSQHTTAQAHASLAQAVELFERADQENTQAAWGEADRAFSQGYTQHAGSSLAGYFLAFQAEVALRQGNAETARELLSKAIQAMSATGPFYGAYKIKLALLQIDAGNPDLVAAGTQTLQQLANDPRNNDRDMAVYYLGLRSFQGGDRAAAEKIWQPLVEMQGAESLWAQAAQAKLDYTA